MHNLLQTESMKGEQHLINHVGLWEGRNDHSRVTINIHSTFDIILKLNSTIIIVSPDFNLYIFHLREQAGVHVLAYTRIMI